LCPRHIDEDMAHHLRRDAEKMRAVLPLHLLPFNQTQIRLIDEGGRLQHVTRPLTGHVGRSQPVKLSLDEGRQRMQRGVVSLAPGHEQLRDIE
jgi:hypothetical protein